MRCALIPATTAAIHMLCCCGCAPTLLLFINELNLFLHHIWWWELVWYRRLHLISRTKCTPYRLQDVRRRWDTYCLFRWMLLNEFEMNLMNGFVCHWKREICSSLWFYRKKSKQKDNLLVRFGGCWCLDFIYYSDWNKFVETWDIVYEMNCKRKTWHDVIVCDWSNRTR